MFQWLVLPSVERYDWHHSILVLKLKRIPPSPIRPPKHIALLEAAVKALQEEDVKQAETTIAKSIGSNRSASLLEHPLHAWSFYTVPCTLR